jgi:AcrR family transcriptional regulator
MPHPSRRDHLLRSAIAAFARSGYHGLGIDALLAEAGVSRKTLYNHFASKDELIVATLETYGGEFLRDFRFEVEAATDDPRARLLAIFDVAQRWFAAGDFHGCLFINAVGEFSESDSPVRRVARHFKRDFRHLLGDWARAAGVGDADDLADQLALLVEGAIVTAQVSGRPGAADTARRAARTLVEAASAR